MTRHGLALTASLLAVAALAFAPESHAQLRRFDRSIGAADSSSATKAAPRARMSGRIAAKLSAAIDHQDMPCDPV